MDAVGAIGFFGIYFRNHKSDLIDVSDWNHEADKKEGTHVRNLTGKEPVFPSCHFVELLRC